MTTLINGIPALTGMRLPYQVQVAVTDVGVTAVRVRVDGSTKLKLDAAPFSGALTLGPGRHVVEVGITIAGGKRLDTQYVVTASATPSTPPTPPAPAPKPVPASIPSYAPLRGVNEARDWLDPSWAQLFDPSYTTSLVTHGAQLVRLTVKPQRLINNPSLLDSLRTVVSTATAAGARVIVDLHDSGWWADSTSSWAPQYDKPLGSAGYPISWLAKLCGDITAKLAGLQNWDLEPINEPHHDDNHGDSIVGGQTGLDDLYKQVSAAVRKSGFTGHLIYQVYDWAESGWAPVITDPAPVLDRHVYTDDVSGDWTAQYISRLQAARAEANRLGVPLLIGELAPEQGHEAQFVDVLRSLAGQVAYTCWAAMPSEDARQAAEDVAFGSDPTVTTPYNDALRAAWGISATPAPPVPVPSSPATTSGRTITVGTPAELTAALASVQTGGVITLKPGTYAGAFVLAQKDHVTLSGVGAVLQAPGGYGLHVDSCSDLTITDLAVTGGEKGIMLDQVVRSVLRGLEVHHVGMEGIHLRNLSTDNIIDRCVVYHTGLKTADYGEAIYVGTAKSNLSAAQSRTNGKPDACDRNLITGCTTHDITAEAVDAKEGTSSCRVINNTFSATGLSGANYADSLIDLKGSGWTVSGNRFDRAGNAIAVNAIQTHVNKLADGSSWGHSNIIGPNTYLDFTAPVAVDAKSINTIVK